ncbi:GHKL domain-containing protein [Dyadobacter soli]|uniref:GHKL domain-containing protein n=1 Tax=Dyadobacter soli TaxID=659014 RepID=A0A1G7NYA0_9BACT|nr:histidine kinase [Dyadobacter soli]SDF78847.1 GHKL domain-containing protein [Dyadobacter soli]
MGFNPISSEKRAKITRIVYHLLAWIALWCVARYYSIPALTKDNHHVILLGATAVFLQSISVFYLLGYVVFPRFLYTRKIFPLIISLVIIFLLVHITNYHVFRHLASITNGSEQYPMYITKLWNFFQARSAWTSCFTDFDIAYTDYAWSLYYITPLLAIKVMRDIINSRTKNMQLEMERLQLEKANLNLQTQSLQLQKNNLNLELSFLKSQINPHFLFNTLNAIYTKTVDVDEQAADLVLKLSDLMRYSLYESSKENVVLSREISYIENYLDLERARFSDKVTIEYQLKGNAGEYLIAPLLLVSFVENAFKHGTAKSKYTSYVKLSIVLDNNTLYFKIKNNIPSHTRQSRPRANDERVGGFGLSNTSKRLQLLYPDRHKLSVQQTESEFSVDLEIELDPANVVHYFNS